MNAIDRAAEPTTDDLLDAMAGMTSHQDAYLIGRLAFMASVRPITAADFLTAIERAKEDA